MLSRIIPITKKDASSYLAPLTVPDFHIERRAAEVEAGQALVVLSEAALEILGGTFVVSAMVFGSCAALSDESRKNLRSMWASSSHHETV